jgi:hypothetical protein
MHDSIQEDDSDDDKTELQYAVPSSSSSSSSRGRAAKSAAAAAAGDDSEQHIRRMHPQLKLLLRGYLRCVDLLETRCEVPGGPGEVPSGPYELHSGELHSSVKSSDCEDEDEDSDELQGSAAAARDWPGTGHTPQQQQQQQQQLSQVSNAALVATARLASRLMGRDCPHSWWARSRGQLVMAEAAFRWKVGFWWLAVLLLVVVCLPSCDVCAYQ